MTENVVMIVNQLTSSVIPILCVAYLGVLMVAVVRSFDVYGKATVFLWAFIPPVCWYSVSRKTLSLLKVPYMLAVILSTCWVLLMLFLVFGLMGSAVHARQLLFLSVILTWMLPALVLCKSFANK